MTADNCLSVSSILCASHAAQSAATHGREVIFRHSPGCGSCRGVANGRCRTAVAFPLLRLVAVNIQYRETAPNETMFAQRSARGPKALVRRSLCRRSPESPLRGDMGSHPSPARTISNRSVLLGVASSHFRGAVWGAACRTIGGSLFGHRRWQLGM